VIERDQIVAALEDIRADIEDLLSAPLMLLGAASPPSDNGVYMFVHDSTIVYVGEAEGSGGLYDRLLRKHLSGDDNHALQRAFKEQFPNRRERRDHLGNNIHVRWVSISDPDRVAAVERLAIWLFRPPWNKK
jgi:hypothetical protein